MKTKRKMYSRKNPLDRDLISKIKIEKEFQSAYPASSDYDRYDYLIILNNKEIGKATLYGNDNFITRMRLNEDYQGKGLMSYLYDYIEEDLGINLISSGDLTPWGKKFWEKRLKNKSGKHD